MDEAVFSWINGWNGKYAQFDLVIEIFRDPLFKTMPYMLVLWALWFWPKSQEDRTRVREKLVAALLTALPIIGITRAIANFAPFSHRPIHTPGFPVDLYEGQSVADLDGWSSMPSDHASLFMGFAVAITFIHRKAGTFLALWAIFVTSLPRIVVGYHWPSDILVGWLIGAGLTLILFRPLSVLLRSAGIILFFEKREMIGYPLLFLATYEFAQMFETSRRHVEFIF